MVYSYYCVDCGRKLEGGNIVFNLSSMLGLQEDPLTLFVSWKDLCSYARNSGITQFESKKTQYIKITLKDVMDLCAEKAENPSVKEKILNMEPDEIWEGKFILDLEISGQNESVAQREAKEFGNRLKRNFFRKMPEKESAEAGENSEVSPDEKKKAYYKEVAVSPEFIEDEGGSAEIYTVYYSQDPSNTGKVDNFRYEGEEIRGYCPHCHAPVLRGTGKYRHIPVGFIGGSRAGKTSLIIAMILELLNNPESDFPEVRELADSRIKNLRRQKELYQKGWKIEKTLQDSIQDSFNASVLVRNQNGRGEYAVFTLVDIAGELCLHRDRQGREYFDVDAIRKYPLIDQCSLYLLCTCISDAGFREDGGGGGIGKGISEIMNGIADSFDRRGEWLPPVGIVLTKSDYVKENVKENVENNPFQNIVHKTDYFAEGKKMLTQLKRAYDTYHTNQDYKNPLMWACRLFQNYKAKTYMSIFYCSATGKNSIPYKQGEKESDSIEQNYDSDKQEIHFQAENVEVLLQWIFRAAGCIPLKDNGSYCCYDIPVYGEAFLLDRDLPQRSGAVRQAWPWKDWQRRSEAVCALFLNQSELDNQLMEIIRADQEDNRVLRSLKGLLSRTADKKVWDVVNGYIDRF